MRLPLIALFTAFIVLIIWLIEFPVPSGTKHQPRKSGATVSPSPTPLANENLIVTRPYFSESVSSPIQVEGSARFFENLVSVRLKTNSGKILYQGNTYANPSGGGKFGDFQKQIFFETNERNLVLEVYESSPKDGSDINKIVIPLISKPQ